MSENTLNILPTESNPTHRDNSLRQFRKICMTLSNENSYLQKTNILKEFFKKGSDGGEYLVLVYFANKRYIRFYLLLILVYNNYYVY